MNRMKALETSYSGYKFRSRLEARWAVFFDAYRVRYEYEKQGYALESGSYLPDFWLPDLECWAEVKPVPPSDRERDLVAELALFTDHPGVILVGTPGDERICVFCTDLTDSSGGTGWWDEPTGWCPAAPHWSLDLMDRPCFCSGNNWSSREFCTPNYCSWDGMKTVTLCQHGDLAADRRHAAYAAARSARFEHGETPPPR